MGAFALYLLKSVIWLTGFSLVYLLFLRNERFFVLKRIYLISGLVVSILFPLISIHYPVEVPAPFVNPADITPVENAVISPVQQADSVRTFDYRYVLFFLYLTGVIILTFIIIRHLRSLYKAIRKSIINNKGSAKLIRVSGFPASFSFFNYIFINPSVSEDEVEEILNHELVHVRQKHWFDLLLVELLRLFQWVNPFAWIYTGFIRLNHEYLADEVALQRTSNPANYRAALVNQLFSSHVISLSNSFNYSLNKKRFEMMKKIITSPYRKLKVLFVLPVFAVVFYAFATPEYHYLATTDKPITLYQAPVISAMTIKGEVLKEDGSPLPGVTIVVSGTSLVVITDANGKFAISDVPVDAILTFSCKGYKTESVKPKSDSMDVVIYLPKDADYKEDIKVVGYGDGAPAAGQIKIINTSNGSPAINALIVIDGTISDRKTLEGFDPNNIASLSVLKDQSATDAFGDKGKNGVILITTKNGLQGQVKGIVLKEDGKPLEGVNINSTGTTGNVFGANTGPDGRFSFANLQPDASLLFFCRGYKRVTLKADFNKEMSVRMEKDPEYKAPEGPNAPAAQRPTPIVVIDDVVSDKSPTEARKELGYNMGIGKMIMGKEATDKYGEKGANGVYEITTRKKALEMGLKPPFPRLAPEDYPTFQGQRHSGFNDWVAGQAKYPGEAQSKKLEGWVSLNFTVELDGTISNIISTIPVDPILRDEVIRVVQSSPKWEPPKNTNVDESYTIGVTLKFRLPDQITAEAPFVVVEQMPRYPGGDAELLNFIKNNIKYPEAAKAEKIEGRVIVRFVVSTEGNSEGISVLKGVHPLLDAEAVRVISMIKGWTPGMQGGKAVNVWYMAPVTFSLAPTELPK